MSEVAKAADDGRAPSEDAYVAALEVMLKEKGLDRVEGVLEFGFSHGKVRATRFHLGPLRADEFVRMRLVV